MLAKSFVRFAILVLVVVSVVKVFGEVPDNRGMTCEDRAKDRKTKRMLTSEQDSVAPHFTCMSDVVDADAKDGPLTFVWIMRNDDPAKVLYAKWDAVGMPIVRNPHPCRMVTNQTYECVPEEKKSEVLYGPAGDKKFTAKMFDLKEKDKDQKKDQDTGNSKGEVRGRDLESRITASSGKQQDDVNVKVVAAVAKDGRSFEYSLKNYGHSNVQFKIAELTDWWAKEGKALKADKIKPEWEETKEGSGLYRLPAALDMKDEPKPLRWTVSLEQGVKFREQRVKVTVYSSTDIETPIAGGKVAVYLPKLPE